MSEWGQSTKNEILVSFSHRPTSYTSGCQAAPVGKDDSSVCYDHRKAFYNPGLKSIEGHKFFPDTLKVSRGKISKSDFGYHKDLAIGPHALWPTSDQAPFVNLL